MRCPGRGRRALSSPGAWDSGWMGRRAQPGGGMRFTSVRVLVYTIAMAVPAVAQPPTPMSREMSQIEVSIGADGMFAGPGIDLERQMIQLGLQSRERRRQ